MSNIAKPDLVVYYTDPLGHDEARLLYWLDAKQEHPRVIVEYRGTDCLGEVNWVSSAHDLTARHDIILSHLLWHIATQLTPSEVNLVLHEGKVIDLRSVTIPMAPL